MRRRSFRRRIVFVDVAPRRSATVTSVTICFFTA
jgi:hypothetical protein